MKGPPRAARPRPAGRERASWPRAVVRWLAVLGLVFVCVRGKVALPGRPGSAGEWEAAEDPGAAVPNEAIDWLNKKEQLFKETDEDADAWTRQGMDEVAAAKDLEVKASTLRLDEVDAAADHPAGAAEAVSQDEEEATAAAEEAEEQKLGAQAAVEEQTVALDALEDAAAGADDAELGEEGEGDGDGADAGAVGGVEGEGEGADGAQQLNFGVNIFDLEAEAKKEKKEKREKEREEKKQQLAQDRRQRRQERLQEAEAEARAKREEDRRVKAKKLEEYRKALAACCPAESETDVVCTCANAPSTRLPSVYLYAEEVEAEALVEEGSFVQEVTKGYREECIEAFEGTYEKPYLDKVKAIRRHRSFVLKRVAPGKIPQAYHIDTIERTYRESMQHTEEQLELCIQGKSRNLEHDTSRLRSEVLVEMRHRQDRDNDKLAHHHGHRHKGQLADDPRWTRVGPDAWIFNNGKHSQQTIGYLNGKTARRPGKKCSKSLIKVAGQKASSWSDC